MRFNYGVGDQEDQEVNEEPDYRLMAERFRGSLIRLGNDLQTRRKERNERLSIPAHIDYISVKFHGPFDIPGYFQEWFTDFGLEGIHFSGFNREVLFAVRDTNLFESFLQDLHNFVRRESDGDEQVHYRGKIRYINDFQLLTTDDIIGIEESEPLLNFQLTEFALPFGEVGDIYTRLQNYLAARGCAHRLIGDSQVLEVYGADTDTVVEIARNFDILRSITSALSAVVRPSQLNTVERGYGFEIANPDEDLPLVGILDTGISRFTPLVSILEEDRSLSVPGFDPFTDNANGGFGHGTAVASLAALGRTPYNMDYRGRITADARLISMKILDGDTGYLSSFTVLDLLRRAKAAYPAIRLFVLTTCYTGCRATNENISGYAYELDKFAQENDCLIFICTANNSQASNVQNSYRLAYFELDETNLCAPAESMNNVTVGAAAGNLAEGIFAGISNGREFPALYTRKGHVDLEKYAEPGKIFTKKNPCLFKPDVIEYGGDYEQAGPLIGEGERASMDVLSANPAMGFYKKVGTSFSTPLVANIAARIQKTYPALRAQTIKALIVNGASLDAIRFDATVQRLLKRTAGHGLVNPDKSTTSDDNTITFVIEDKINPGEMKVIPIHFPAYLTSTNLGKKNRILRVTATLCFSFDPVYNNQAAYCPQQMAFAIFRNHTGEEILRSEEELKSKLKKSWSQNNRWRTKPVPASNVQKISFVINVQDLLDETSTLKLAVHCLLNKQLLSADKYKVEHPFSMAITIEETLPQKRLTGRLYNEMLAINEVEQIVALEGDATEEIEL